MEQPVAKDGGEQAIQWVSATLNAPVEEGRLQERVTAWSLLAGWLKTIHRFPVDPMTEPAVIFRPGEVETREMQ